ncbi:MAG: hypothetical protein AB7U38_14915, partial [Hyphomicrobiales bacterium]
ATADGEAAEETSRRKEPPQRTQPSEVRGFVTHLAAGLMGGVAGVVAAGIGLDKLPFVGAPPPPAVSQDSGRLAELAARIEKLEQKPDPAAPDLSALENRLAGIDERIAAQVKAASEEDGKLASAQAEQAERVARLDSALKALGDAARQGGGEAVGAAAAVAAQVDELTAKLESRVDALEAQAKAPPPADANLEARLGKIESAVAGLEQNVSQAAQNGAGADPAAVAALDERIAAAEKRLDAFAETAKAAGEARSDAALAVALPGLRRAMESGRPFETELAALETLLPPGADIAALEAGAAGGVASLNELRAALPEALRKAAGAAEPASDSLVSQLMSGARDIVKVRKVGEGAGDAAGEKMRKAMAGGDIAAALAAAQALPAPARAAMQGWLDRAAARLEAERSLATLERAAAGLPAPAGN